MGEGNRKSSRNRKRRKCVCVYVCFYLHFIVLLYIYQFSPPHILYIFYLLSSIFYLLSSCYSFISPPPRCSFRCDIIANGVINAAKTIGLKKPVIIRLKGTNVEEAKKLIAESPIKMVATDDFNDAANKAVKIASIITAAEEAGLEVQFS
jgi:hypothetical protein